MPQSRTYTIAVRELCEFAAKSGDLDLRFTPAASAKEGQIGHRTVAARRSSDYRAEVPLVGEHGRVRVRGRADGWDRASRRLEEIKTFKGDLSQQRANHRALHWAQAKVYAHLMCVQEGLAAIDVALVYFDVQTQEETSLVESMTAAALRDFFQTLCERFVSWADQELAHRAARDEALTALPFAHGQFRTGQRDLAEAVYRATKAAGSLLAQAPTGIGKTVGTLYPALKACATQGIDKLFFLTAKSSGAPLALEAVQTWRAQRTLPLRVLELTARDKACEHPDKSCDGHSCPLARGFYDRLPAAREAAAGTGAQAAWTRSAQREIALAHDICPYHFGQELARWSDVTVCDYSYFYDTSALLHGLTLVNAWRAVVLVDEAHNLVDRARAMYSAKLDEADARQMHSTAPPALRGSLKRLIATWDAIAGPQADDYATLDAIPDGLAESLRAFTADTADWLTEHSPAVLDATSMRFWFDSLHLLRLAESFGAHSLFEITREAQGSRIGIRNVVPAAHLKARHATAHASVLFSATLAPFHFYRDMLGLADTTPTVDIEAPFTADQLDVRIVHDVSTRWKDRARSVQPIAAVIADQWGRAPGNYLAFLSSYDYLTQVADAFAQLAPQVACWRQTPSMSVSEQQDFIARFVPDGCGVGFAVLGGSFAEGVDLPGSRLIGAFVATLGLPQWNAVNEATRRCMDASFGDGHAYAYLFPGLRKVVQAAGRVIRTPNDRGTLYLIDERFMRAQVRALLPTWWAPAPIQWRGACAEDQPA